LLQQNNPKHCYFTITGSSFFKLRIRLKTVNFLISSKSIIS